MRVGVPAEIRTGETRVALVPETVGRLVKSGVEVAVQTEAGHRAGFPDSAYTQVGAVLEQTAAALWSGADLVVKIHPPQAPEGEGTHEADLAREGGTLLSFLYPVQNPEMIQKLAARQVTAFALDRLPRISRAQSMDALSSMSTVAGYRAVLLAAGRLGKFFPLLMTAAGTIPPARVLVLGAGVAGLQAIATARRLGAVVEAFDVRPAVKEQVESLGARFVEVDLGEQDLETRGGYARELGQDAQTRQREAIARHVRTSDVVITTALVPGKRAPVLVTREMVESMQPGSVVVDLAAESGGNCELTRGDEEVAHGDVTVLGCTNAPAQVPLHASAMFSRNVASFLQPMLADGALRLNFEDEIQRDSCVIRNGEIQTGGGA